MAQIKPRTLSGFMELLPARQVQFDRMVEILRKSYSLYGFTPWIPPAIEAAEVLLAKGGGETEKQIYRFTKGDSDLALRFDLTVPLAKYVALHQNELTFPFRRFQISKVYRESGPRRAATGSSTRRTSTSSATAAWTSPTRQRSPPSSTRPLPPWVCAASRSGSTTGRYSTACSPSWAWRSRPGT